MAEATLRQPQFIEVQRIFHGRYDAVAWAAIKYYILYYRQDQNSKLKTQNSKLTFSLFLLRLLPNLAHAILGPLPPRHQNGNVVPVQQYFVHGRFEPIRAVLGHVV